MNKGSATDWLHSGWLALWMFVSLSGCAATATASGAIIEHIEGVTELDAEGFISLAQSVPDLTIIDARIRNDQLIGYIEDSISLPDIDTNCTSLARVIPSHSSPVVFYCNGRKCGRSARSSRKARECGYRKVYWFRGGFEEWLEKKYPYLKK